MPRLTDKQYLKAQHRMKRYWLHANVVYSHLTASEQRVLHDFYRPAEDLTAEELLAHRTDVLLEQPDLAQRAGRAVRKIDNAAARWALERSHDSKRVRATAGTRRGKITVRPVYRPKPDYPKLVAALRAYVIRQQELEAAIEDDSDSASPPRAA